LYRSVFNDCVAVLHSHLDFVYSVSTAAVTVDLLVLGLRL